MLFKSCNVTSTLQAVINAVLQDLMNEGVIAYIDDILIYTEIEKEHVQLVQQVQQ